MGCTDVKILKVKHKKVTASSVAKLKDDLVDHSRRVYKTLETLLNKERKLDVDRYSVDYSVQDRTMTIEVELVNGLDELADMTVTRIIKQAGKKYGYNFNVSKHVIGETTLFTATAHYSDY